VFALPACNQASAGSARANVRYRVFEVPAAVADKLVDPATRTQVDESTYFIALLQSAALDELIKSVPDQRSFFIDRTATIDLWPRVAHGWSYSRADGEFLGGGSGGVFLGVRLNNRVHEIHIESGIVTHNLNSEYSSARIFYEGPAPENQAIVFIRPFSRFEGTQLFHVVAFETSQWSDRK